LRNRREERTERAVVGVAAGIRFDGDVLGHRQQARQSRFIGSQFAGLHQRIEHGLRWRRHEMLGDFGARDLGEDVVGALNLSRRVAGDAAERVAHNGRRQCHEGRRFDAAHPIAQQQPDDDVLQRRLLRGMDEIAAPGQPVAQGVGERR